MEETSGLFSGRAKKTSTFSFGDKILLLIALLGLSSVALSALVLILKWQTLPPVVPLFYSKPWGTTQLAPKGFLFVLPLLAIGTWIADFIIINATLRQNQFLTRILAIFGSLSMILFAITLVKIILQVGA